MSGASFTPGPWSAEQFTNQTFVITGAGNTVICEIGYRGDQVDTAANASLIATAPEFFAEAVEFCRRVECGEIRSSKTYAAFRALIAKADPRTGRKAVVA